MPSNAAPGKKLSPLANAVLLVIVLTAGVTLVVYGSSVRSALEQGLALVRTAGPGVFFPAMAVLPAVGVPVLTFLLVAGPVFGERLGMGLVLALSLGAITLNIILSYFVAKYALHSLLERMLRRFGYELPKVEKGDATDLAIIVRVTPGIPFFVQNYLLGLAGVPFLRYLMISCLFSWSYAVGFVLFGDALLQGKGKIAMIAISLLIAATAATHLARKHYQKRMQRQ